MQEVGTKVGIWHIDNHEYPAEFSAKAEIKLEQCLFVGRHVRAFDKQNFTVWFVVRHAEFDAVQVSGKQNATGLCSASLSSRDKCLIGSCF